MSSCSLSTSILNEIIKFTENVKISLVMGGFNDLR